MSQDHPGSLSLPTDTGGDFFNPLLARKRRTGGTECFLLGPLGCSPPGSTAKTTLMQSCSSGLCSSGLLHTDSRKGLRKRSLFCCQRPLTFWIQSAKPHSLSLHLPGEAQLLGQPSEAGHIPLCTHTHPELVLVEGTKLQKGSPLTLQQVMKSKATGGFIPDCHHQVGERGHRASWGQTLQSTT